MSKNTCTYDTFYVVVMRLIERRKDNRLRATKKEKRKMKYTRK